MSNEERQRQLRETGSRPAEAEKQSKADEGREARGRQEGERAAEDAPPTEEPSPAAEDEPDKPRPRR